MISSIQLKDHLDYPDEVEQIIKDRKFYELLNFTNFSFCKIPWYLFENIILSNNKIIIKHVIDNMTCVNIYNCKYLIHHLVRLDDIKLFDYFVTKYFIDLNLRDLNSNATPIHFACRYGKQKIMEYLVDKGVDLNLRDNSGWQVIHYVCRFGSLEMIEYMTNKKEIDLESRTGDGIKPIHMVCHNGEYDSIKLLLSKNIDLTSRIKTFHNDYNNHNVIDTISNNSKLTLNQRQELIEFINKKIEFSSH